MPKYCLSKSVPWSLILDAQRCQIQRRLNLCGKTSGENEPPKFLIRYLQESTYAYSALRSFLGYTNKTALQKKVEDVLEAAKEKLIETE